MRSSSILPELRLDSRFSPEACVRKTIGDISGQVSRSHGGVTEKISKLEDHANRLRDEMKKIDAFKRELPLCMILLADAIVAVEEELDQCRKSNVEPVLEEFMPLTRSCRDTKSVSSEKNVISCRDKMNWMSSVQLWNFDLAKENPINPVVPVIGKEKRDGMDAQVQPSLSLCTPEIMKKSREGIIAPVIGFSTKACSSSRLESSSGTNNNDQSNARKQRRCWSAELHRLFTNALQQLGGAQAATPKQIRELMRVEGLTNDEVKSHLQKYRLHAQRLSSQSAGLWNMYEVQQCNESSLKQRESKSGSPEGPLHFDGSPEGNCGSNEDEDELGHNLKGGAREYI